MRAESTALQLSECIFERYTIPWSFFHSATWNVNVMATALTTTWTLRTRVNPRKSTCLNLNPDNCVVPWPWTTYYLLCLCQWYSGIFYYRPPNFTLAWPVIPCSSYRNVFPQHQSLQMSASSDFVYKRNFLFTLTRSSYVWPISLFHLFSQHPWSISISLPPKKANCSKLKISCNLRSTEI